MSIDVIDEGLNATLTLNIAMSLEILNKKEQWPYNVGQMITMKKELFSVTVNIIFAIFTDIANDLIAR